jgi:hypothetical protein
MAGNPYILIVPGIGGNEMFVTQSVINVPLRVWLDYGALIIGGWRLMMLGGDGFTPAFPFQPALEPHGILVDFYGDLVIRINSTGRRAISTFIDWRFSQSRNINNVLTQLIVLADAGPVTVVCHSRGGLVMRRTLAAMTPDQRAALVARVICCGTPHYGSWAAPPFLGARDPFMAAIVALLGVTDPLQAIGPGFPGVHQVMCSWPGLYELLPRPGAPGVDPQTIPPVYNPAVWAAISSNVLPQWLAAAETNWATMPAVPADVQWVDIYGEGVQTPTALLDVAHPELPGSYDYTPGGDGVVPSAWAVLPRGPRIRMGGISHGALMQADASLSAIVSLLDPSVPLPPPP